MTRVNISSDQPSTEPNQSKQTVPTPVPRKSKEPSQSTARTIHYANHEAIQRHRESNPSSSQNASPIPPISEISDEKSDLTEFDPIPLNRTSNEYGEVIMSKELGTDNLVIDADLVKKCSESLIDLMTEGCFVEPKNSYSISKQGQSSDLNSNSYSQVTKNRVFLQYDESHQAIVNRIKELVSGNDQEIANSDPIYEEINEAGIKSCLENVDDNQVTSASAFQPSKDSIPSENSQKVSSSSENKDELWTCLEEGKSEIYDYDALKFDRNLIIKEASLGLTSLEASKSGSQMRLNELDLSK